MYVDDLEITTKDSKNIVEIIVRGSERTSSTGPGPKLSFAYHIPIPRPGIKKAAMVFI